MEVTKYKFLGRDMEGDKFKEQLLEILDTELRGNFKVLFDPKRKDSLTQWRINTWVELTKERIYNHLVENNTQQSFKK